MALSQSAGEDPEEDGDEPGDGSLDAESPASGLTGQDDAFGFGSGGGEPDGPLPPGTDLGGVTIERLLGEGGMGRVYAGWQASPRRRVAIKVIRAAGSAHGAGSERPLVERLERFAREAEFLARLRHPHIAQIHTFGLHADPEAPKRAPRPFFVMELVDDARPITRHAALRRLSVRERLTLFRKVCGAVAHAHAQGVVHRDLKPANILVGSDGEPKVIDFGVARADDASGAGSAANHASAALTMSGDVVGTLHYMSPEQLQGEATAVDDPGEDGRRVDGRSDVYALGLVLHQLLTGVLPYDLHRVSLAEAVRLVCGDAAPDTTRVEQAAAAECGRDDARALATLVAKCLEKRPADRYQSAGDVAAELDRWLAGQPILARPPTALESVRRFGRRHRAAAAAIVGVAAAGLVALVGISVFWVQAERQRREADRQTAQACTQLYFSNVLLAAEARDRGNIAEARRLLAAAQDLVASAGTPRPIELACLAASLDESLDVLAPAEVRAATAEAATVRPPTVNAVAWSPAGDTVAVGDSEGGLRLWRRSGTAPRSGPPSSGPQVRPQPHVIDLEGHDDVVWAVVWAPDAAWLASASADGHVAVWDAASGRRVATLAGHEGPVYDVDVSPDGTTLVTAGRDGTVRVWGTQAWDEHGAFHGHRGTVYGVAVSPDGLTVASGGADGSVRIWSLASGAEEAVFRGHEGRVFDVAFSPGNTWLATASEDGTARIWDLRSVVPGAGHHDGVESVGNRDGYDAGPAGEAVRLEHPLRVNAVRFIEGADGVVTAAGDGILRVWDLAGGREHARLHGHAAALWSMGSRQGVPMVATGSADGTVRVWGIPSERDPAGSSEHGEPAAPPILREQERVLAVACDPGGRLVAAALADGRVRLRDATTFRAVGELEGGTGRVHAVAFSPDGGELVAGCDRGTVCMWRLPERRPQAHGLVAHGPVSSGLVATEPVIRVEPHSRRVYSVAYSPDGTLLATAGEDGTARVWQRSPTHSGWSESEVILKHPRRVFCVAFAPDGRHVATACEDRLVRLWDARDGRQVRHCGAGAERHGGPVNWLAFTTDGARLATASSDATVRLWRVADGRLEHVLQGPARQIWKVAFSLDGQRVAAVSADGTAQIWDAASGRAALMLRGHADQAWAVAFTPSGDALLTGGWDRTLRVWGLSAAELARRR